jgi:hypothetical protein
MSQGRDEDYALEGLFQDPSTNGHINKRINNAFGLNLDKVDLTQPEREQLWNLLILLSKKLATTWRHLDRYRRTEDDLVAKAQATPLRIEGKRTGFDYSDELYAEFDGFLVQMKSSLDYLANVPRPVFGPGWKPYSFGDKGDDIIKLLENNTPERFADRMPVVCDLIRWNQDWLQEAIDLRDKVNHFQRGGVPYQYFRVHKEERDAQEVVRVPMWTESETVRDVLGDIWRKLMCFCEAFIGATLYMRLQPYWGVRYEHHEDEGEWEADDEAEDRRWEFTLDIEAIHRGARG